ncbi:hypothetical protein LIER_19026 [Lithospermum erythrorhizon]|uniref:Integrase catalytic domain-containing protein n=1 Tax=Lithospermum erythrorhizon TaxID=34254 RepID=A0AAV3QHS7_LITER
MYDEEYTKNHGMARYLVVSLKKIFPRYLLRYTKGGVGGYWRKITRDENHMMMGLVQHQTTTSMTPILNHVPFAIWGTSLVGKLLKAKGSLEYLVVVVDYFSKRVEDTPLKKTGSDNTFESEELAKFCEKYNIEHRFSPVYYPQCNGQVEVMNHIFFKGIKKNMIQSVSKKRAWIDELPVVLWSVRITHSHATGETPFILVYGSEVVLPTEARLPTYFQLGFNEG